MDKVSILRGTIQRFYNKIKSPAVCPSKKCLLIRKIESIYERYIIAIAFDETVEWQQFYDIVDLLNDNLNYLKQKYNEK